MVFLDAFGFGVPPPSSGLEIVLVTGVLLMAVIWRANLPEWLFPLRGRWLRCLLAAAVSTGIVISSAAIFMGRWTLWDPIGITELLPW